MMDVGDIVFTAIKRRRLMGRSPADDEEPFDVDCSCGTSLGGFRRQQFSELRCPHCGASIYIQPRNPRRSPKPRRRQHGVNWPPSPGQPRHADEPLRRVTVDTPPDQPEPSHFDALARSRYHLFLRGRAAWGCFVAKFGGWRRVRVTRLQLIMTAVTLMLLVTGAWQWDRYRQKQFAKDLVAYTALGIESLDSGEFFVARDQLRRADRAARGLRGQSPRQRTARQLYRESIIWSSLAVGSIHRLTSESADGAPIDPGQWPEQFRQRFIGRCLIFNALVSRVAFYDQGPKADNASGEPGESELPENSPPRTELRLEWAAIAPEARIEIRLPDVEAFAAVVPGKPRLLLFGARLISLEPSPTEAGLWLLRLEPESCVLLTVSEPLEHLGWPNVDPLRTLILRQARDLGVAYE